jgi:hypothetical protein
MTREQALRRLQETSNFTMVGGLVRLTDRRILAAVAEARAAGSGTVRTQLASGGRQAPGVGQTVA